jgi:hypothetical protein
MSKHLLSLVAGASILVLAGTASAGGISLTNKQMDAISAGSAGAGQFNFQKNLGSNTNNDVTFRGNSAISDTFSKRASIDVNSHVTGNSASLAFDNEALGKNTNVQGAFSQETIAGQLSSQSGLFVSAANGAMRTPTRN